MIFERMYGARQFEIICDQSKNREGHYFLKAKDYRRMSLILTLKDQMIMQSDDLSHMTGKKTELTQYLFDKNLIKWIPIQPY